jgi:putative ABC transport system permease protein
MVDSYAADKEVAVGDSFTVMVQAGTADLEIVGLITKEGVGIANEGVIGFVPLEVAQELFNQVGLLGQVEVVVEDEVANDSAALESLRQQMEDRLGDEVDVKYPASRGQTVANSLQSYQLGLNFFSVVSLFVGSFLIYNAFAMTVVERTREIGMLRAVGMTRRQIVGLVLLEAFILGIAGSILGVIFGLALARLLIEFMSTFTGQRIEIVSASPESLLQAMVVGLLVTIVATALPALQAARISPLQALRIQGSVDERRWLVVGLKFGPLTVTSAMLILYFVPFRQEVAFHVGSSTIFALLLGATLCIPIFAGTLERLIRPAVIFVFGTEGRLGSSNIERARGRTTLTVAALMIGISMVVGIRGLTNSFETDIQQWVGTAIGGDLYVRSPLRMQPDMEARLNSLDGVAAVTKARYVGTRIVPAVGEDEFAIFAAIDPATYLQLSGLQVEEGPEAAEVIRQLAEGDAIMVSVEVASRFNLDVGDTIELETKRGRRPFRVAAIIVDFTGGEILTVTGSWGDLRRYFGVNDVDRYTIALAEGASAEAVTAGIENGLAGRQHLSVESRGEFEQKLLNLSSQAFALFDVLGLIGLVVAALGVVNTMLMNVLERTRELGGLRSLGMTQRQVRRMILAEASTIGLIGALFGLAFGAVLIDVFIIGLSVTGGLTLKTQIPYLAMVYSFFIAFAVALGAAWYPAVRASRVNIIEAIKNE